MDKVIYKYDLGLIDGIQPLMLPLYSDVLTVQDQSGHLQLWALINEGELMREKRFFEVFGTGHIVPNHGNRKYISTVQMDAGNYVFHIFERLK
jgi:hypothetical protein